MVTAVYEPYRPGGSPDLPLPHPRRTGSETTPGTGTAPSSRQHAPPHPTDRPPELGQRPAPGNTPHPPPPTDPRNWDSAQLPATCPTPPHRPTSGTGTAPSSRGS